MKINKKYISRHNTYQGENVPKYIVIHETDNYKPTANGLAHALAQSQGHLATSVHFYCGDDGIYQVAKLTDGTFSVGREYGGLHSVTDATNRNTINIEICVNEGGDYAKARMNCIELVKYIMKETNIPAENVIRHYDAKGKYCPRKMMDEPELWSEFKRMIVSDNPEMIADKEEMPRIQLEYAMVCTQRDPLVLREGKSSTSRKILSMPKGATVEVLERSGDWWCVEYNGCIGYAFAGYLQENDKEVKHEGYVTKCTGNGVRVRVSPEFTNNVIGHMNKGDTVNVIENDGVWAKIYYNGREAYMYAEYVE